MLCCYCCRAVSELQATRGRMCSTRSFPRPARQMSCILNTGAVIRMCGVCCCYWILPITNTEQVKHTNNNYSHSTSTIRHHNQLLQQHLNMDDCRRSRGRLFLLTRSHTSAHSAPRSETSFVLSSVLHCVYSHTNQPAMD